MDFLFFFLSVILESYDTHLEWRKFQIIGDIFISSICNSI